MNIRNFQKKSLTFKNYYNHTFATFMGLQGQLYSGYQQNNYDKTSLIPIHKILKDSGYSTCYVLTEPKSSEMVEYIDSMGFDEVITENDEKLLRGASSSISDKDAYRMFFDTAMEENKEDSPFFLAMYTLGTHVGLDSVDEKFGNGANPVLNRFYDMDVQFGAFFEKFMSSPLADNTIIFFTTDHASYQDNDFMRAFPDYHRKYVWLDKIPLSVFYKGVVPNVMDAGGRNSIDLAPTILDFLDISGGGTFLETVCSQEKNRIVTKLHFSRSQLI